MERKWKQEKALREAAEHKAKALKKKLNALKDENKTAPAAEVHKEDASAGTNISRTNSFDGTTEFLDRLEEQSAVESKPAAETTTQMSNGKGMLEARGRPPPEKESPSVSPHRAWPVSDLPPGTTNPEQNNGLGRGVSRSISGSSVQGLPTQVRPMASGASFDGPQSGTHPDRPAPVGGRSADMPRSVYYGPQKKSSITLSRHSAADFDPLRPSQTESQGSSVASEPIPTATQMFASRSVGLPTHGHLPVNAATHGTNDLMDMQASAVHVRHPSVNGYMQGSVNDGSVLRSQMQVHAGTAGMPSQPIQSVMLDQSGQEAHRQKHVFDPYDEKLKEERS